MSTSRIQHRDTNKKRGVTCPICNNIITISIEQMLHAHSILCPHCGLRISIDKSKSDKAIEILKKFE